MSEIPAAAVAQAFHEAYERLAPSFGYKTREASAVPWEDVPEQNKNLMIAVAAEVATLIQQATADEIYEAADAWDAAHTDRWRDRWAGHISTGMRKAAAIVRDGRVGGGGGGGQ
jgi:ABC-type nitrate/sulfonate/bicarbonate transport system ATPase subunit